MFKPKLQKISVIFILNLKFTLLFDICLPALYQCGSGPAAGRDFEI
jgi:hypothetical protein